MGQCFQPNRSRLFDSDGMSTAQYLLTDLPPRGLRSPFCVFHLGSLLASGVNYVVWITVRSTPSILEIDVAPAYRRIGITTAIKPSSSAPETVQALDSSSIFAWTIGLLMTERASRK
jgi:hypothetical protein